MSAPSTPGSGPGPTRDAGSPELPEHFLRRESERIAKLLRVRRRATMAITIVFVFATAAAFLLLTRYVQGEKKRIDHLSSSLASADQRLREQDAWLGKLEKDRALVDSILTQYQVLIAAMRDSAMQHSDRVVAVRDSALRAEVTEAERRAEQRASLAETTLSRSARTISDSLGSRLAQVEGLAGGLLSRLDTISPRVARYEQRLRKMGMLADSLRRDLRTLDDLVRQDSATIRGLQLRLITLEAAMATTEKRLERLEAQRVAPNLPRSP